MCTSIFVCFFPSFLHAELYVLTFALPIMCTRTIPSLSTQICKNGAQDAIAVLRDPNDIATLDVSPEGVPLLEKLAIACTLVLRNPGAGSPKSGASSSSGFGFGIFSGMVAEVISHAFGP